MSPTRCSASDFVSYPSQSRALAIANLALLQQLPLVFAAILLRDVIGYDWKFPAERVQLEAHLGLLSALPAPELESHMQGFSAIRLSPELERANWISNPSGFMEQLTAWLWSSGQMESFRGTAEQYASFLSHAIPTARPAQRRLAIVVIGYGVTQTQYPLFRKLRPNGIYLTNVKPDGGLDTLLAAASKRAVTAGGLSEQAMHDRYAHWYIEGGTAEVGRSLTLVSYGALERPRALLLARIERAIDSGSMGPETLRSLIARMQPAEIGLAGTGDDAVLDHFKMSLLTEGSGTQIFATTFVQWAARECLRRAQPETVMLRYAPRQEMQPMNVMLSGAKAGALDPHGSLIDADMGAYYTWLNMNRLAGADEMSFLVWWEGQSQAIAIGPGLPHGTTSDSLMDMQHVLRLLS